MTTITLENATEAFKAITPVVKVALDGQLTLIGTAFFITGTGVVMTAKHVILDNLTEGGNDIGGIGVISMYGQMAGVYRSFKRSSWHSRADIAISETAQFREPNGEVARNPVLSMSALPQRKGELVSSQFFHDSTLSVDRSIITEQLNPLKEWAFRFEFKVNSVAPNTPITADVVRKFSPAARITHGTLTNYYARGRDTVMLPFPAFESNMPIYAGASGGPVFNTQGEVIAINCTRFEGSDASYHTDIICALDLSIENTITLQDRTPRSRTVRELASLSEVKIVGL